MNLSITEFNIYPEYPDNIIVTWSLSDQTKWDECDFNVFISDSNDNAFVKVNNIPIHNEAQYRIPINLLYKQEYIFVKIELINSEFSYSTEPKYFVTETPFNILLIAQELVRKKNLLRSVSTGIECVLRKRKIFGVPCLKCTDPVTNYCTDPNCLFCYGTKIVGGFSAPQDIYCEILEGDREIKPSEMGTVENIIGAGFLASPIVTKGDVIIEKHRNARWCINSVTRTQYRTLIVDQKFNIRRIAPKDIEYKL